jgi:hypothetical protein
MIVMSLGYYSRSVLCLGGFLATWVAAAWFGQRAKKSKILSIGGGFVIACVGLVLAVKLTDAGKNLGVLAEGLTNDTSKLRLIKAGSNLFADEKAKLERETFEAEKRSVMKERLSHDGRYITMATTRVVELLEEDAAKGLSRIRVHNRYLKRTFELWTQTSNIIPFDKQLAKQGDDEYEAKFRGRNAKQAERERWLGKGARIKEGAFLFADDDGVWWWIEMLKNAHGNSEIQTVKKQATELAGAKRLIISHGDNSGIVVNAKGPYFHWLQIESRVNGNPARFWVTDDDVTIEEPKPDPSTAVSANIEKTTQPPAPKTERSDGSPSDEIIRGFTVFSGSNADVKFKRGSTLVSTGGRIPKGTMLFPVRHDPDYYQGEMRFYFFRDEFGDWKLMLQQERGRDQILSR